MGSGRAPNPKAVATRRSWDEALAGLRNSRSEQAAVFGSKAQMRDYERKYGQE